MAASARRPHEAGEARDQQRRDERAVVAERIAGREVRDEPLARIRPARHLRADLEDPEPACPSPRASAARGKQQDGEHEGGDESPAADGAGSRATTARPRRPRDRDHGRAGVAQVERRRERGGGENEAPARAVLAESSPARSAIPSRMQPSPAGPRSAPTSGAPSDAPLRSPRRPTRRSRRDRRRADRVRADGRSACRARRSRSASCQVSPPSRTPIARPR